VEIANSKNFLDWTKQQPWMVLHELAHGYHHRFLENGFGNPRIEAAYRKALESKSYESVLHISGQKERAYALTDPMEYFAETSECYFGTNDFYPFVRAELHKHDPEMFKLLEELWNLN
jgi:Mlc titration factor MtfA (ptsG expression regulator)